MNFDKLDEILGSKKFSKLPDELQGYLVMIIRGMQFYYLFRSKKLAKKKAVFNFSVLRIVLERYWKDRQRVCRFHNIKKIDEMKVAGHFTYWISKLKPIKGIDEKHIFLNEELSLSFSLGIIESAITGIYKKQKNESLNEFAFDYNNASWLSFVNEIKYSLKYRIITQDMISLIYKGIFLQTLSCDGIDYAK